MKRLITVLILGLASLLPAVHPAMAQDPERPKATASEVVDRETLKAFVEGGKEYLEGIRTLTETAKLRDIFRAEGDWKSGSMFLVILVKDGAVLLHGGDATIDNGHLIDVEDDKSKKVVQELLAAADQGGDFVEYYWDDPGGRRGRQPQGKLRGRIHLWFIWREPRLGRRLLSGCVQCGHCNTGDGTPRSNGQ